MRRSDCAVVLVSAPVMILAVGWLTVLALAVTWHHPVWDVRARNLSEAAAFRDGGEIARRISAGENPAYAAEVRPGFISGVPANVTPFEAAAKARRSEIIRLLLDLGATLDATSWTRVWCTSEDDDLRKFLAPYRPAGATSECREGPER